MHEGMCNAQHGETSVHVVRKPGEQCVLDFVPDSFLDQFKEAGSLGGTITEDRLKEIGVGII